MCSSTIDCKSSFPFHADAWLTPSHSWVCLCQAKNQNYQKLVYNRWLKYGPQSLVAEGLLFFFCKEICPPGIKSRQCLIAISKIEKAVPPLSGSTAFFLLAITHSRLLLRITALHKIMVTKSQACRFMDKYCSLTTAAQ